MYWLLLIVQGALIVKFVKCKWRKKKSRLSACCRLGREQMTGGGWVGGWLCALTFKGGGVYSVYLPQGEVQLVAAVAVRYFSCLFFL